MRTLARPLPARGERSTAERRLRRDGGRVRGTLHAPSSLRVPLTRLANLSPQAGRGWCPRHGPCTKFIETCTSLVAIPAWTGAQGFFSRRILELSPGLGAHEGGWRRSPTPKGRCPQTRIRIRPRKCQQPRPHSRTGTPAAPHRGSNGSGAPGNRDPRLCSRTVSGHTCDTRMAVRSMSALFRHA